MREFEDVDGRRWIATVAGGEGLDYKGRFHLVLEAADGGVKLPVDDVEWNSERTAARSLETMSLLDLRRRLRVGMGRRSAGGLGTT